MNKRWISVILVLAMITLAGAPVTQAQTSSIVVSVNKDFVRFSALGEAYQMRVEVITTSGEKVFDSGYVSDPAVEWFMQDENGQPVKTGEYAYTLTLRDRLANQITHQKGNIIVDRDKGDKTENASEVSPNAATAALVINGDALENPGGDEIFGPIRMRLQNRYGINGALFEMPAGGPDLIDNVYRSASGQQRNLRFEARPSLAYMSAPEFQLGDPTNPTLSIADNGVAVRRGNLGVGVVPQTAFDLSGAFSIRGSSTPVVAPNGQGRIYFDSATGKFKVSENGGAFVNLLGSGGGGTITGVTAGTGLTGGGTSGNVTLRIDNGGVNSTQIADNAVTSQKVASGQVVKGIVVGASTLKDNVTLAAGSNITITPSGNTLTIAATGGGGGLTLPFSGSVNSTAPAFRVNNNGNGEGVHGTSTSGIGVLGESFSSFGFGVYGRATGPAGYGVYGQGGLFGVRGYSNAVDAIGVAGQSDNGPDSVGVRGASFNGYAGYFFGKVRITGNLSKGGGSFKIDHPLDPENKYLYHSFVESPDMMNIYNDNVVTNANGEAVVTLPDYFEALNRDFRYQLTVIGQFAQAIVASEIKNNRFTVKTDKPNVRVSWQVTGIRKDPYAEKYRIPVEENKTDKERGYYLHPDVYGQAEEKSVEWARNPEMMRLMKQERERIKQQ